MNSNACMTTMPDRAPGFVARLAEILAATDQAVAWWGQHRAWPANDPVRVEPLPRRAR